MTSIVISCFLIQFAVILYCFRIVEEPGNKAKCKQDDSDNQVSGNYILNKAEQGCVLCQAKQHCEKAKDGCLFIRIGFGKKCLYYLVFIKNELFTLTEFEYARYAYTAFVKGNANQINLKTVLFILTPYFLLKLLLQVYHIYRMNASF